MAWGPVLLAIAAAAQTVLLAWIAAWQARAAREVRRLNGSVEKAVVQLGVDMPPAIAAELELAGVTETDANVRSGRDVIDRPHSG